MFEFVLYTAKYGKMSSYISGYLVAVEKYLKKDDWYMFAHMTKGTISLPIFTSLDCYWPGIQVLIARRTMGSCLLT